MSIRLDFDGSDFRSLSREEQISKCHEMARKAARLAQNGNPDNKDEYSDLAARWSALARDMEGTRRSESTPRGGG